MTKKRKFRARVIECRWCERTGIATFRWWRKPRVVQDGWEVQDMGILMECVWVYRCDTCCQLARDIETVVNATQDIEDRKAKLVAQEDRIRWLADRQVKLKGLQDAELAEKHHGDGGKP